MVKRMWQGIQQEAKRKAQERTGKHKARNERITEKTKKGKRLDTFVWPLSFTLYGMGDATREYALVSIALEVHRNTQATRQHQCINPPDKYVAENQCI